MPKMFEFKADRNAEDWKSIVSAVAMIRLDVGENRLALYGPEVDELDEIIDACDVVLIKTRDALRKGGDTTIFNTKMAVVKGDFHNLCNMHENLKITKYRLV